MLKSRLKKIAEIIELDDGTWMDDETGEMFDQKPEEQSGVKYYDEKPTAQSKYLNSDYYNQWGKVSPFNIIIKDYIGQWYGQTGSQLADLVCNLCETLNKEFGSDDKTYDYVSQKYLNEIRMNLNKCRTSDKAIEYLTNIYFKGMGMGGGKSRWASRKNELIARRVYRTAMLGLKK